MKRAITIEFDEFGWSLLNEHARTQKTTIEEIVLHATAYYLADLDSGRMAARVLPQPGAAPDKPESPPGPRRHFSREPDDE